MPIFHITVATCVHFIQLNVELHFSDRKYESVILPVHGFAAPFHISTIKVCTEVLKILHNVKHFSQIFRTSAEVKKELMCICG